MHTKLLIFLGCFFIVLQCQLSKADSSTCPPLPAEYTKKPKTGQKSWDKCFEWLELAFPCKTIGNTRVRENLCGHDVAPLITGTEHVKPNEFPHVASLGYEDPDNIIQWDSAANLISDEWVISAAHATYHRAYGADVKHVRFGGGTMDSPAAPEFLYTVIKIVNHPDYRGHKIYNDIALLQLDRKVKFSASVIPGCLHVGNQINDDKFVVTEWRSPITTDKPSNTVYKVVLEKIAFEECFSKFSKTRKSPQGILNATQICAGGSSTLHKGVLSSALQIYNPDVYCTYTLVGIPSVDRMFHDIPEYLSIYTRISAFIPWIESVVWP